MRRMILASALALCAALLAFSAVMSAQSPLGIWHNRIFGDPTGYEPDPGSYYLAAAHDLEFGRPALYVGHPGTPLMLLLAGVQRGVYAFSPDTGLAWTAFSARNLPSIAVASKLLVTVLHLVSFALLFAFALELLRDELAAACACLGYATSLPVLFYLSRISVEPLMMICVFGAFLALWRWQELASAGDPRRGRVFAALAGVAAVTGVVTKLNFLAPLPLLLLLEVAVAPRAHAASGQAVRERWLAVLALTSAGVITLWFWSHWIEWPAFFAFWSGVPDAWNSAARAWNLVPAPTAAGALPLCEFAFLSVALVGWADVLRRPEQRPRVLFVSAFAVYCLVLFAYRVFLDRSFLGLHYFLPAAGILAVFFGHATARMLRGLTRSVPVAVAACAGWLLLMHGLGAFAVLDSRLRDVAAYQELRPAFEWIERLASAQQAGVRAEVRAAPEFATRLSIFHTITLPPGDGRNGSSLRREFEALFVPIDAATAEALAAPLFVPVLGAELFALDGAAPQR
jgi:hypothetical protein